MPETGGPDTSGDDVSHGDLRCDACETKVLSDVEKSSSEIRSAIDKHFAETGHKEYSFYGRTKMEAQ